MKSHYRLPIKKNAGNSVLEFVVVLPIVIISILLIFEIAFMAIERHMLSYASYAAGKSMVNKLQQYDFNKNPPAIINPMSSNPIGCDSKSPECLQDASVNTFYKKCDPELANAVSRKVAFVMSGMSPTMASLGQNMGISIPTFDSKSDTSPILKILERLPAARMLTRVTKCSYSNEGVTLTLTYNHIMKTPFAGTALWAIWSFATQNRLNGIMDFELDENFFGVKIKTPKIDEYRDNIKKSISDMAGMGANLEQMSAYLKNIQTGNPEIDKQIAILAANDSIRNASKEVNQAAAEASNAVDRAAGVIKEGAEAQEDLVTTMLYLVPEAFRMIPLKKTVFISWSFSNVKRVDKNNMASFIHEADPDSNIEVFRQWHSWAKDLAVGQGDDMGTYITRGQNKAGN